MKSAQTPYPRHEMKKEHEAFRLRYMAIKSERSLNYGN